MNSFAVLALLGRVSPAAPLVRGALVAVSVLAVGGCQATQDLGAPPATVEADAGAGDEDGAPLGLRAFVTAASFTGDLVGAARTDGDGHAAGDALCQAAAAGAGLTGVWIAYLSSGADSANDHVVDDGPFYAVDGTTKLYESKLGVGAGAAGKIPDENGKEPIDVTAGVDQFGKPWSHVGAASFWTGSSPAGQVAETCSSWTASDLFTDGSHATYLGASTVVLSCKDERHLLCLEQKEKRSGRPTKKVFVTRKTFRPDFEGGSASPLARADTLCAAAATDGGLTGTFVAWLSARDGGALVRAADRLDEARYVRVDGEEVFSSKAQLSAGPLVPINVTELGEAVGAYPGLAWTGTLQNGTPSPDYRCLDWTSTSRDESGVAGDVVYGGDGWTATSARSCSSAYHLYCFEK
jgi:hypothetical protein